MMKKICLCFFSGTGMTKYVVDRVVKEFEQQGASVDCFEIENIDASNVAISEYDLFGIAYPIHSLNAPQLVINFAKRLPNSNNVNTFIICTCGDDNEKNYSSSDLLSKKLKNKGYKVFYDKLIQMPLNFAHKDEDKLVKWVLKNANEMIPLIAKDIIALKSHFMKRTPSSKRGHLIGRAEWLGCRIAGKFYYTESSCVRCGKCVDNCPKRNIVMTKKSVKFKHHCSWCMRCIYSCPKNAINVRRPFKFIRFDDWYDSELFK